LIFIKKLIPSPEPDNSLKKEIIVKKFCYFCALFLTIFAAGFASAAPIDIYVSILPQKWLLEKVGGDLVIPHVLVNKGQDPHTFEPTPRQVVSISAAKAYFTMNMQFENIMLNKLIHNNNVLKTVDITNGIERIAMNGEHHHDDAEHDHHDDMLLDPHVWLSVSNLKIMASNMAAALITMDKANAGRYKENLATADSLLTNLQKELSEQLAPFKGERFFVFHPSFGYFAHEFGLEQEAVEIEGKTPSPRQLSNLIQMAKEDNVKVIFTQPQFDKRSAQAIASAIGGSVVPLDPLAEDVENNLRLMAANLASSFN